MTMMKIIDGCNNGKNNILSSRIINEKQYVHIDDKRKLPINDNERVGNHNN